jgi:hypothetical protein
MRKILIYGNEDNPFFKAILMKSQLYAAEIDLLRVGQASELFTQASLLDEGDIIILININMKESLRLKQLYPVISVFACHGGEKDFRPTLTLLDLKQNHRYFNFEDWDDFWQKIIKPVVIDDLLVSATERADVYRVNYENLSESDSGRKNLDPQFFWFAVYFSRVYLDWFQTWLNYVVRQKFSFVYKNLGSGKLKKLFLPFANIYQGEFIFREGEDIVFFLKEDRRYFFSQRAQQVMAVAKVVAADEDGLEIFFQDEISRDSLRDYGYFGKGDSLLARMIAKYRQYLSGYGDLSRSDYIYFQDSHYDEPEDFLRGYLNNNNNLHRPIHHVKLDGPSKLILQDRSQMEALLDILGPKFVSAIKGPPGTGKTLLSAVAIKQFLLQRRVILVSAHSNQGLDNLLSELLRHVDSKKIFRLGNDHESVTAPTIRSLHRHWRYQKEVALAEKTREKNNSTSQVTSPLFCDEDLSVNYETEDIWRLICAGESFVLASTINSYASDRSLHFLATQSKFIDSFDFSEEYNPEYLSSLVSEPVSNYMQMDNKKMRPKFMIDVVMIDEATKGRFFEFVPLFKAAGEKLVLIGDPDQLGNIPLSSVVKNSMLSRILSGFNSSSSSKDSLLYSVLQNKDDHALLPIKANYDSISSHLQYFSQGMFYSLLQNGLSVKELSINRRSLPIVTSFLNNVFDKHLQVGRFNPYQEGRVTFLDLASSETRIKTSYYNQREASFTVVEVIKFFEQQVATSGKVRLESIGIIPAYRGQIKIIRARLRKVLLFHPLFAGLVTPQNIDLNLKSMLNTVDAFQGAERDTIILNLIRSNAESQIGFMEDERRFYVALSRARNHLIIIGDSSTFLNSQHRNISKILVNIINFTKKRGTYSQKA